MLLPLNVSIWQMELNLHLQDSLKSRTIKFKNVFYSKDFSQHFYVKNDKKGYNEKFFCSKKSSFGIMATKSRTIEHKNKIEQTSYSGPGVFFKVVNFLVLTKT